VVPKKKTAERAAPPTFDAAFLDPARDAGFALALLEGFAAALHAGLVAAPLDAGFLAGLDCGRVHIVSNQITT
jgi:hypothetical protein